VIVPVYNGRTLLRLIVHRDCLSRAVTHVRIPAYSYLYAFCLLLPLA